MPLTPSEPATGADHLLLIDGNNLAARSLYGMADAALVGPNGVPTGGVFGSINVFRSLVARLHPTHVLWTFDGGKSTMRTALYPEYKANRKNRPQDQGQDIDFAAARRGTIEALRAFLNCCGIPHFTADGVEADDLIADAVRTLRGKMRITVFSADHDLRQLCTEDGLVRVLKPGVGRVPDVTYDHARVLDEYGLPPHRLPEMWAITGDPGDGVDGVRGLGPKRALKILTEHGTLERALDEAPKLAGHRDVVLRNLRLISLLEPESYLPEGLEQCRMPSGPAYPYSLSEFLTRWGFETLRDLLDPQGEMWT